MANTNTNFNFFDWTRGLMQPKGRYNAQGQWITDEGVVSDPYTGEALDPLLEQIKDTSELSPAEQDQLLGAQMGPSNQQPVPITTPSPVNNVPANDSGIDPNSDVLDIVRGIAEDNPVQGAALNPVQPSDWASRFQEPMPDRPYVPVEGEDDLMMEPDSEFEPVDIPEDRNEDFYDMLGLSRRERRKLEKERIESGDDNVEERPGKIPEGTSSYDARFMGDLDGDGYVDNAYLPKDTPASEEDLKGPNVEDAPVTDKGDVTSTKKTSSQEKMTDYTNRAQAIKDKYEAGEINRFQRNRLNRKLRREIFKNRKEFGGKKNLDKKTIEMMAGPVGKYVRNYPKRLKKNLGVLRDIAPDLLSAALQAEAGGMPSAGAGEGGGEAWSPEFFNQTVQLSNPYMNILNRIMGNRMDD
tara:strand:- start:215 stop:1447 length:1233 start_codon:yes stop_codon:yes gene_type:complete